MSTSLALIDPGKRVDNDQREDMLDYIKESKGFLKASGYTDKGIQRIKVSDLKEVNKKASEKITINSFEKWVESGVKSESFTRKIFRRTSKPFKKAWNNLAAVLGIKRNRY